MTGFM